MIPDISSCSVMLTVQLL